MACTNRCRTDDRRNRRPRGGDDGGNLDPRRARLLPHPFARPANRPRTVSSVTPRLAAAAWYDIASR